MMTKVVKNYWVDIILLISGVICIATGYVIDFHMLSTKEQAMIIKHIHVWSGYFMTIAVIFHVIWHMNWLKNVTGQIFSAPKK